jgi:PAS domain S-box-containing protein/diguanylate cyclase (GGDEF)-like protein
MTDDDGSGRRIGLPSPAPPGAHTDGELSSITRRVVTWYVAVASVWIVVSDLATGAALDEDLGEVGADVTKGLVFVAVTGAILWIVLRRLTGAHDRRFASSVTAQRDFYQSILRSSSDAIIIFDDTGTVRYVNDSVTDILGRVPSEVVGQSGRSLLHPNDLRSADTFRQDARRRGRTRRTFRFAHRDGTFRALEVSASPLELVDGTPGAVVTARDVSDRSRGEQQLRAALAEDATGLPNLRMFVAEMERLAEVSIVGLEAIVVLVDIDRFSDVNALHGRAGGDAVLLELTHRLEAVVPEAIGLWRHGADEILAVLIENPSDAGSAIDLQELVDRIQQETSAPLALQDVEHLVSVSVSVGVARLPIDPSSDGEPLSSRMLRTVEQTLAEAKQHPDRSVVQVHPESSLAGERALIVAQLHGAVERGELVPHFQPKVCLSELRVVGAEALVRWQHPERGLLLPADFLRSVEVANLTGALTRGVLRDSLAQVPGWLASAGCDPDFQLSVNITLDDLRRKRFVHHVFETLEDSGVDPRYLCLELTEQTMLEDALGASTTVAELRRAGIRIAIDDFGTGYSSLEHIRVFEVDVLKIDKGFVQRLGRSRTDEAIVDSILAIAGRLDLTVTAEGIEDVGALEYLRERGCDQGQGFLFSPAVPVEEFSPGAGWGALLA